MRALVPVIALAFLANAAVAADMDMHGHGTSMGGMSKDHGAATQSRPAIDTATTRLSDDGHFKVSIASRAEAVSINQMEVWELTVVDEAGKPVEGAAITIDGRMPEHGHGLPTAPRVTKDMGGGNYLVEGVKFNMTGRWQLTFGIDNGQCKDKVVFNLVLN